MNNSKFFCKFGVCFIIKPVESIKFGQSLNEDCLMLSLINFLFDVKNYSHHF